MIDPFATFRAQCEALIRSRVPEPAGYVFEEPPRREMGHLACNVAFQLPRIRKSSPSRIAEEIVASMDLGDASLVRDVRVAGPGFINFFLNTEAYGSLIALALKAEGDQFGRGESAPMRRALIEHTSTNPNKAWHIGHARNAVLGDTLARLFRFAGHQVEVQNYIDDTGKQVADMIFALRHFSLIDDEGHVQPPDGRKLDHYLGDVYARYYEILGEEKPLQAELAALSTIQLDSLEPRQVIERAAWIQGQLDSLDGRTIPEDEMRALQESLAGWRAAALVPSHYHLRAAQVEERLRQLQAMREGAVDVQHQLEQGIYRELVRSCLHAQLTTAWRLHIYYDLLSWEQDVVRSGLLTETIRRLEHVPAVRLADSGRKAGCLVIEMGNLLPGGSGSSDEADSHSSEVVLVRSNGLPTYIGKDVAYHYWKFGLLSNDMLYTVDTVQVDGTQLWTTGLVGEPRPHFPATEVINLIDSRQSYPQQVVGAALRLTGHGEVGFHHVAYGVVSARLDGIDISMSGRFGNGVPADDVLDSAATFAYERIKEKQESALDEQEMRETAEKVAAAAMRYVMIRYNPLTEIVLDPVEMVEFEGNTGAYLLYAYARIAAILRKAAERGIALRGVDSADMAALKESAEVDVLLAIGRFPHVVRGTLETLAVNALADYAFELATTFSQFYNRCPILNAQPPLAPELLQARLGLVVATGQVMRNLSGILGIELVERL